MEKDDVLALIRSLLTSTSDAINVRRLQREFKEEAGCDLPTFGYRNVQDFLRSVPDCVRLVGEYPNEEVRLVKSEKSAHVAALVDNQRDSSKRRRRRRPGRGRPDFRNDIRRDTRPPRPRQSSYNSRSYSSSSNLPPRFQNSQNSQNSRPAPLLNSSIAYLSPHDKLRLHDFLKKYPDGATFEEVTRHMLGPGERWAKYYIHDGVPELVEHCKSFCKISGNLVFTNEFYDDYMRRTRVEVPSNGYMPAGNESEYSSDEFFDYDSEEDGYAQNYAPTQEYSNKSQLPEQCDIRTIKTRLKEIVRKYENGIYCSELFSVHEKFYGEELEFNDYGYSSLIEMLNDMPEVVSCSKTGDRDWKVYDSEKIKEDDESDASDDSISCIKSNLLRLLRSKNGVLEIEVPIFYYRMFNKKLEYREFGYETYQSFINSFENKVFYRVEKNQKIWLYPVEGTSREVNGCASNNSIPPKISTASLYPEEVVGPNDTIPKIDLRRYAKVDEYVEVSVLEIWNPSKFYLQLRQFKADLWDLMDNLQVFYKQIKDHYKMPEQTLVPDQICAALYDLSDDNAEWHRAIIVKVIDEETVCVNLFDYGTLTKIAKNRLRFLHKNFTTLPCQAIMAKLANTEPKKGLVKWPREANKRFVELVLEKDLVAGVVEMDHTRCWMSVALSFTEGTEIHISDTLVQEGLASFTIPSPEEVPKEQLGPKKAMKTNEIFVLEDEPEDITLVLNSSNESNNPKPEKSFSNTPLSNPGPSSSLNPGPSSSSLNPNLLASAAAMLNTIPSVPLMPNLVNPLLNYGIALNTLPLTTLDPTTILLSQMAGLSLNSAVPTGLASKAPPPGFSNFQQIDPQEELRNRIKTVAVQLFSSQPEIRAIALSDPELGLKIAMKIAEDLYMPKEQNVQPQVAQPVAQPVPQSVLQSVTESFNIPTSKPETISQKLESIAKTPTTAPNVARVSPSVKANVSQAAAKKTEIVTGVPRRKIQVLPFEESSPSDNEVFAIDDEKSFTPEKKNSVIIKECRLQKKPIHLILINQELFILVEEVIKTFTPFSSKKVADKIVDAKRCSFKYRKVTELSDPDIYETITRANISKVADHDNEFTILPLKSILKYLRTVANIDEGGVTAIVKFIASCEDENRV